MNDPAVEGVLIATSHQSHRPLVEQVAAAGKHVFVDKPLATTVAEGSACVEAARAAGVLLQVGQRRTVANRHIKVLLDTGELGDVETVVVHQSVPTGQDAGNGLEMETRAEPSRVDDIARDPQDRHHALPDRADRPSECLHPIRAKTAPSTRRQRSPSSSREHWPP